MNGNDTGSLLSYLLIILVVSLVVFLICRELFCWYWKINQRIDLLIQVRDLLAVKAQSGDPKIQQEPSRRCPKCGAQQSAGDTFCDSCGEKLA
jgi:hypothetical protein